jgi:uncharacterized protein YybS (DUF2232 family)
MDFVLNIYRHMGIAEKDLQYMSSYFSKTVDMIKLIFPSALVVSGLTFSVIDYKLTRLILKRIGHELPDIEKFSRWRIKEPYSFILIGLAVLATAVSYFKISELTAVALNISTVVMLVFSLIGVSVIVHYSRVYGDRYDIPKALRTTIVVLAVLIFMQFVALLGILDMVLNLRKLEPENSIGGIR